MQELRQQQGITTPDNFRTNAMNTSSDNINNNTGISQFVRESDTTDFSLAETPFQGYQQWVPSTFVTAMVFKFCMVLVWFFLQGFIYYVTGFSG